MRVKPDQLEETLRQSLRPVYLIAGDEPLQVGEAADAVRAAARRAEYTVREVIAIEQGNEWPQLAEEADSLSIFADKKLIDLRLPSAKPGQEGSKALTAYCQRLPADTLLLISAGKIDAAGQKSQWFQAIEHIGAVVQVWPLQGPELLAWLRRRAERKGMRLEPDALKSLAGRIEGNLLAAAQEIEKLFILYGQASINKAAIDAAVADSSRFDVFKLTDAWLAGKRNRAVKILNGLRAEGVAAPVVLWALSREARVLFNLQADLRQGGHRDAVFKRHQIRDMRRPLLQEALGRFAVGDIESLLLHCAKADAQAKGQAGGDAWETLFHICSEFCRSSAPKP